MARSRVTLHLAAVESMVARKGESGAALAARFMESEQKKATRSRRLRNGITRSSGRDAKGIYARAGVRDSPALFFWVFEEYETGRGGGQPFIRQSLFSNTAQVARMLLGDSRASGASSATLGGLD